MPRLETYFYLPGDNDNEIWDHLTQVVTTEMVFDHALTQGALLDILDYERGKVKSSTGVENNIDISEIPNAPFAVPIAGLSIPDYLKPTSQHLIRDYETFTYLTRRLLDKDIADDKDSEFVSDIFFRINKLLNPHTIRIYNKNLNIRDTPIKEETSKVANVKAHAECKTDNGRQLVLRWDTVNSEKYNVKVFDADKNEIESYKDVSGGIKRVTIVDDEPSDSFFVRVWLKRSPEPTSHFEGPFNCPKNESAMNNKQVIDEVDKFRMKIDGRYKTIFDLIELLKIPYSFTLKEALEALAYKLWNLKTDLSGTTKKMVKWEHLELPIDFYSLRRDDKILAILSHAVDSRIRTGYGTTKIDSFIDALYPQELLRVGTFGPFADVMDGGTQRLSGKRKLGKTSTLASAQVDNAFFHAGKVEKQAEVEAIFHTGGWKGARDLLKKFDRIDGRRWHPCCYLETSVEQDACSRLRRIERLLRLSHQRGYPVIDQNVAAPFEYTTSTTNQRFTTFGPNNYDRTQIFPQVQPVPFVMASERDAASSKISIVDPQKSFSETNPNKHGSRIDVLKHDNASFFDHPLYPSAEKKKNSLELIAGI